MSSHEQAQAHQQSQQQPALQKHQRQDIWVITGPAGCGKSTVASHIAQSLSLPYIEGDEYHTRVNIDKMSAGIPLTDADRWDWLILLREECLRRLSMPLAASDTPTTNDGAIGNGERPQFPPRPVQSHAAAAAASCTAPPNPPGVILTCSALKRAYRDVLRVAASRPQLNPTNPNTPSPPRTSAINIHFIYLRAPLDVLISRVSARQGHYMKESMVRGQFLSLEEPASDEGDCLVVDVGGTMGESQSAVSGAVEGVLEKVVEEGTDGL